MAGFGTRRTFTGSPLGACPTGIADAGNSASLAIRCFQRRLDNGEIISPGFYPEGGMDFARQLTRLVVATGNPVGQCASRELSASVTLSVALAELFPFRRADPRPMRVWVYCIAADIEAAPEGTGYARAEASEEAVALVGHPEATEPQRLRR